MALKVKAKEREMKIGKNPGVYRYVMLPELYSTLDQDKVISEACDLSRLRYCGGSRG